MPVARHAFNRLCWVFGRPLQLSQNKNPLLISKTSPIPIRSLHQYRTQHASTKFHRVPEHVLPSVYASERGHAHRKSTFRRAELQDHRSLRELNIEKVYQELRQIAFEGNVAHVQKCVEIIVQDRGEKPNARLYDALLLANTDEEHGSAAEAARLLNEMISQSINPDSGTYHAILRVLAIHPDYLLRQYILNELRQRWFQLTKDGWHDVVIGLIRDRALELAQDTMNQMHDGGIRIESWLYDMMIYTLCSAEEFDASKDLMERRLANGELNISQALWFYMLDTGSRALHHSMTLFAYRARVETSYLNPPAGMCINILSTAARHGDTFLATSVLRILGRRSGNPIQLYHYEALLETYMAAGDIHTAFMLLTIMSAAGCPPTEASTRPIYSYLSKSHSLAAKAIAILKGLNEQDRHLPIQAINVVMQAAIYHCDLTFSINIYKSLHTLGSDLKPNTATFNLLFRGCAQAGRKDLAMFLASEMVALNISPDILTYDRLILVCLNSEDTIEDAWRYFGEMQTRDWWPRQGTALALARRSCEHGDDRVWKLVDGPQHRGISHARMQSLLDEFWKDDVRDFDKTPRIPE